MTNSSWDETAKNCAYHFDNTIMDPRWDNVIGLGRFVGKWDSELQEVIKQSTPATWATRGYKAQGVDIPTTELTAEEYDLERIGMSKDSVVSNLTWEIPAVFQKIADSFCLDDAMVRLHVQYPGQVWNLHLDKLQKWCPKNPEKVVRLFIQLTDWQPGHFWSFGNYNFAHWRAGDVVTMDWQNCPHSTANAGHSPRVTLQVTGVKNSDSEKFLTTLRSLPTYKI